MHHIVDTRFPPRSPSNMFHRMFQCCNALSRACTQTVRVRIYMYIYIIFLYI